MTNPDTKSQPGALWLPLWAIMAAVGGWGLYHTIGALRSDASWQIALTKALIIFGCVAGFLGFWAIALKLRAGKQLKKK